MQYPWTTSPSPNREVQMLKLPKTYFPFSTNLRMCVEYRLRSSFNKSIEMNLIQPIWSMWTTLFHIRM